MISVGKARLLGKTQRWCMIKQGAQGDLHFEPRQGGTNAEMEAAAKRCVDFAGTGMIKHVGLVAKHRVVANGPENQGNFFTTLQCDIA